MYTWNGMKVKYEKKDLKDNSVKNENSAFKKSKNLESFVVKRLKVLPLILIDHPVYEPKAILQQAL